MLLLTGCGPFFLACEHLFSDWLKAEIQQHGGSNNMVVFLASFLQLYIRLLFRQSPQTSLEGCYRNCIRRRGAVTLFVHRVALLHRGKPGGL